MGQKYPRSLHANISLGSTSDDRFLPHGFLKIFKGFEKLVLTEKLDGQNDCLTKKGVFARSHTNTTAHPWDRPIWERWEQIKNDLGDLEVFAESMYAIHSIEYKKLESFLYVIAIREGDTFLSWEDTKIYATMLNLPTVPEIQIKTSLKVCWDSNNPEEDKILRKWLKMNLGMDWEQSVETGGLLGGIDTKTGAPASEGFVIRNADSFKVNNGILNVAENEMDSVMKIVRPSHVGTNFHWTRNWKSAKVIENTYGWYGHNDYVK